MFSTPQEHLPLVPHYQRFSGMYTLAHILKGSKQLTLSSSQITYYSSQKQPYPTGVDLVLKAKWRWHRISIFDLWAEIKSRCPNNEFSTLTPKAFIEKWEKSTQINHQTGYHILHSHLFIKDHRLSAPIKGKRIKGGVVDGACIVEAREEKKCKERVSYHIAPDLPLRKTLTLTVPISEYGDTEFFTTPQGERWFERAQAIADNYFQALNRQTKTIIECVLSPDTMARLSTDTCIERFGKIVEYAIVNDGKGYMCRILCAQSAYPKTPVTKKGEMPQKIIKDSNPLNFVNICEIDHLLCEQNQFLSTIKDKSPISIPPTAVYLVLKDLRTRPPDIRDVFLN